MSLPELTHLHTRRDMRKALIRLRMEMHRQEIRHESRELLQPLQRMRGLGQNWQANLGLKHAPLWGIGLVTLLGFFGGKGAKGGGLDSLSRWARLSASLLPLIRLVVRGSSSKR
ncbi:hypothetical protein HX870_20195 [Pseudomonas gingeri]|uniref:YqjK-like protein n=1 Tax=Pseudomonas gingeri TaxID=117681 RepID=A0A7Y8C5D9_9PSED|nr:hypothetical protein [Pseudomonas gingeri]NWA27855.1 hypothetical protein [Pseudomonas gingeri]NWC00144.1 hypothetical protein [Pseudomonas gingeri]NWD69924.1 hypothetical protein [Pseudomonas gingeri]NWD77036.1 hypothetical protein [Pseudomonas gingeri]